MGFEVSGLDEMTNALGQVQELYPKEIKKFMQSEGTKLKNRTLKTAKSNVKKKMGNYFKVSSEASITNTVVTVQTA